MWVVDVSGITRAVGGAQCHEIGVSSYGVVLLVQIDIAATGKTGDPEMIIVLVKFADEPS